MYRSYSCECTYQSIYECRVITSERLRVYLSLWIYKSKLQWVGDIFRYNNIILT